MDITLSIGPRNASLAGMPERAPQVVVVGGGFGGLATAKALKNAAAEVILIDRTNHHLFQPLSLSGRDVGINAFANWLADSQHSEEAENTTVILGEVMGVDPEKRQVLVDDADRTAVPLHYDFLVLATGATQ